MTRDRIMRTLFAATLIATLILVPLIGIQTAKAQSTFNFDTYSFVSPSPALVGVGQQILIIFGIDALSPIAIANANHFQGFTIKITKPDGTSEVLQGNVDSTSAGYLAYTPGSVGTYKMTSSFAGQWVNVTAGEMTAFGPSPISFNRYYKPSTSGEVPLTVQQEPVPGVTLYPLPTDYWTRPINVENKGWINSTDNWLMMNYDKGPRNFNGVGAFSPYTIAPDSPHILWSKQLQEGGLVGALMGDNNFYPAMGYEQYYQPIILNGKIIYVDHGPTSTGGQGGISGPRTDNFGTRSLDLYTGEENWFLPNVTIDLAQTLLYNSVNKHAVLPYLWSMPGIASYSPIAGPPTTGLTWTMYDSFTGIEILNINSAVGGFPLFGPSGEILVYTLDFTGHWMSMWNSTQCVLSYPLSIGQQSFFYSPPRGTVLDYASGIQWNVTLNAPNAIGTPGIWDVSLKDNAVLVLYDNRLDYPTDQISYPPVLTDCAYPATVAPGVTSLNPTWVQNRTNIHNYVEPHININEGMYSFYDDAAQQVHTYSMTDGREISVSPPLSSGNYFTVFSHTWMAYGNTYVWSYDGYVRCVNGKTGNITWTTFLGYLPYTGSTGFPAIPVYQGPDIADGKIFIGGNQHSPDSVLWSGDKFFCLDAFTGQPLWNISSWIGNAGAISDGYLTTYNAYDVKIYTYGKGPSATTVSAPQTEVPWGTKVMITGTVTDQSPGQKDAACVSEESMAAWMEYLHMQKPFPSDAKGVTVSINVLDANNNFRSVGTTTSDANGFYSFVWQPDIPGKFTVVAKFAGSPSYGSSYGESAFVVSEAPEATVAPTAPPASIADQYFVPGIGIIVAAIAVVGAIIVLMLRKK
jgi:hypothetical protein